MSSQMVDGVQVNTTPAPVIHVARFILDEVGREMSTMKLQKLCYFAQGWTLAWTNGLPLFSEDFEAWRKGPVCRDLWKAHSRRFSVSADDLLGERVPLERWQANAARAAIEPYKHLSGVQLSTLTHKAGPWVDARVGLGEEAPSTKVISKDSIQRYFQDLDEVDF